MILSLLWLFIACSGSSASTEAPSSEPAPTQAPAPQGDHATVHHDFDDVDRWVTAFDDPSRDAWQRPQRVVDALAFAPGQAVADIGAGTGYFNAWLAAAVGPKGRVIAVDIAPALVEHMKARAAREETPQVEARLGASDDPGLKPGEVDRVLIVNTYHHIDGRKAYFGALRAALREGGRLVVVDYDKRDTPHGPEVAHRIAPEQVVGELGEAGWQLVERRDTLPEQYLLVFEPTR